MRPNRIMDKQPPIVAYTSIRLIPYEADPYNAADMVYAIKHFKDTYLDLKSDRHSITADSDIRSTKRRLINP